MFTRILYGSRISLSIGLIGVALSFIFGVVLGGISGFYGGVLDVLIQRFIEFIRSVPSIPLWMALSASLPQDWSSLKVYFGITIILSLIGWTFLARAVRGRFLSMREEEFVLAARFAGASEMRIILRHMVPSFFSHLIASATLAVPSMILSETSLSFLGLGLRPPAISWGVLLQESQNALSRAGAVAAAARPLRHHHRPRLLLRRRPRRSPRTIKILSLLKPQQLPGACAPAISWGGGIPESALSRAGAVAAAARPLRHHHRPRAQLLRRRPARRSRPVPLRVFSFQLLVFRDCALARLCAIGN